MQCIRFDRSIHSAIRETLSPYQGIRPSTWESHFGITGSRQQVITYHRKKHFRISSILHTMVIFASSATHLGLAKCPARFVLPNQNGSPTAISQLFPTLLIAASQSSHFHISLGTKPPLSVKRHLRSDDGYIYSTRERQTSPRTTNAPQ